MTGTTRKTVLSVEALECRQMLSANPLTAIAAGSHGTAYGLDAQGHVYQQQPGKAWSDTGLTGKAVTAGTDAAGNDEAYVQGIDNRVYRFDQGSVTDTQGKLTAVQGSHGEAFGLDGKNVLWVYNDASGWKSTGKVGTKFAVGTDAAGRDEVFLKGTDARLYRLDNGAYVGTNGGLASFQAGRGEVFGLDGKGALWLYNDATGWKSTGKAGTKFSVGTDAAGRDEVFLKGTDGVIYRYDQGVVTSTAGKLASFQAGRGAAYGTDGQGDLWRYDDKTGWADQHVKPSAFAVGGDGTLFVSLPASAAPVRFGAAGSAVTASPWTFLYENIGDTGSQQTIWYAWNTSANVLWRYDYMTGWSVVVQGGQWGYDSQSGYYYVWQGAGSLGANELGNLHFYSGEYPTVTYVPAAATNTTREDDNGNLYMVDASGNLSSINRSAITNCYLWTDSLGQAHVSTNQGQAVGILSVVSGDARVLFDPNGARLVSNGAGQWSVTLRGGDGSTFTFVGL